MNVLSRLNILAQRTNKKGLKKQVEIRQTIELANMRNYNDSIKIKFVQKAINSNYFGKVLPIFRADDFNNLCISENFAEFCKAQNC